LILAGRSRLTGALLTFGGCVADLRFAWDLLHYCWTDWARHIDQRVALDVDFDDVAYRAETRKVVFGMSTVVVEIAIAEACDHTFGNKV